MTRLLNQWLHGTFRAALAALLIAGHGCEPGEYDEAAPGEVYDAGVLFAESTPTVEHTFEVMNTTDRVVRMLSESHSCDCTEVEISLKTLRPGESTPLTMSVAVPQGMSDRELECVVQTDHPTFPEWTYFIRFKSFLRARVDPARIDFGALPVREAEGSAVTRTAWLETFTAIDRDSAGEPARGGVPRISHAPEDVRLEMEPIPATDVLAGNVRRSRYRLEITPRADG